MPDGSEPLVMKTLKEVGRYAVGITWGDGHESILPYRDLRAHCPCDACRAAPPAAASAVMQQLGDLQRLGDATLVFRWGDGHESLFVAEELRALCRCAYCAGEPNYPITNQ
ncbi:MAG: DUF971 domain-containing protein [Deltaproteobacteria bacterium]|nr:MAG: DUF971 domain-containing protein [Deltaproteobacteria bacterium]